MGMRPRECYYQIQREGQSPMLACEQITSSVSSQKREPKMARCHSSPQFPETLPQPEARKGKDLQTSTGGKTVIKTQPSVHTGGKPLHSKKPRRNHTSSWEKPFPCQDCDKSFRRLAHLNIHQIIHTGTKPFQCEACGKSFRQLDTLKTHQSVHKADRPFQCPQCDRNFRHRVTLRNHERLHTGERPFYCTQCGRTFNRLDTLKGHLRVHTKERPYQCKQCDKRYRHVGTLKKHQNVHTVTQEPVPMSAFT